MRFVLALAALAAAPAAAADFMPMTTPNYVDTTEITRSYADVYGGPANERERVLARLNSVCKSDDRYDKRRCASAWKIINAAYADLQAKKAAGTTD